MKFFTLTRLALAMLIGAFTAPMVAAEGEEVPVFITIGQSNADGSAMFDADEDARLQTWYASDENRGNLKIWYRSTYVQNQTANSQGEAARWVFDGTTTDVQPGWLNLWYRNENTLGRTAMNMIHGYGTWSTGTGTDCAQGRRGMEGEFGMKFAQAFPDQELYIIKLGVSGSFISSWANSIDNHNWDYFYENMFKPAIADLIARGKRPRLAGIWWMQGCADQAKPQAYYEKALRDLIKKCRQDLGFADGKVYIGGIVKPGENPDIPTASAQFGQGVRDAQNAVVATVDGVEFIDTRSASMQYESNLGGYVHFDHKGVNAIGDMIAEKVIADGPEAWAAYSTPGHWTRTGSSAVFTPAVGQPEISYSQEGDVVTATLTYPGWTETKTYTVSATALGPGYLDCDGTRYMTIPHSTDFDVAAGGSMTVTAKVWLDTYGAHRGIVNNRYHEGTANAGTTGFDIYGGNSSTQSMSNNVNLNKGSWNNLGHPWCNTLSTGRWQWITWVYNGTDGTSKMYLDGVLKDTRTNSDIRNYPLNPQCDMLVGARYLTNNGILATVDMSSCWKGKISDVRFYNRALNATEVVAEMTNTVGPETDGLFAAYDFSDINGLTVTDITGNGHNGQLVGFPSYTAGSEITIATPANGTLKIYDGGDEILSGQNVPDGTRLNVAATPAKDYTLKEITVNGVAIAGTSFTVDGPATVAATFERDPSAASKVLVFDMDEDGSKYYRIPAIVTAADGSLVAVADKRGSSMNDLPNTISVVTKRSTDGGETWSSAVTIAQGNQAAGKTYGDPAVVLDKKTGNLVCVFSGDTGFFVSTKSNRAGFYVSTSSDNGVTWTAPRAITDQIYQSSWYGAFAASGSMLQTESGRIMFVANTRLSSAQYVTQVYEFVCASDDGGQTWQVLNKDARIPSDGQGNESKLVECSDGSLIMSIRSSGHRRFARSTDGGVTWTDAANVNDLPEPSCNGDIIVYPSTDGQKRMLHSLPANTSTRRDVTVFMSYDDGHTWPVSRQLIDGYSAYSSLTVLPDGKIGCFVEEGKWDSNIPGEDGFRLYFMKFDLNWLTQGADNGDENPDNSDVYDGTLNLDGTRYMVIPNDPAFNIPAGGSMTVSLKAKIDLNDTHTYITNRVRRYENGNNNDVSGWSLYSVPSATTTSFNYPGSAWTARHHNASSAISTGQWHHLCWVYSGTSTAFYIDGVPASSAQALSGSAIPSYADILVGAGYVMNDNTKFSIDNLNNFVKGHIDDVRIYGEALSTAQISTDGESATPVEGVSLIAAYDFETVKGLSVTDISGNGHTGQLVGFPENAAGYTLTITTPDEYHGTLEVYNGDTRLVTGRKVTEGTELRVVATPADNYILKSITANDVELDLDGNEATFVVSENVTVAAEFERDPNAPIEYCIPTGTPSAARYVTSFTVSDNNGSSVTVNGNGAGKGYTDRNSTVFTTAPGAEVTVNVTGFGEWQQTYLHIDYGRDGTFDVDPALTVANGDLVSFNGYRGNGTTFYNSKGVARSDGHTLVSGTLPSFVIPADLPAGDYQARLRLAWDKVDACLSLNDVGTETGRACIDFMIHVEAPSHTVSAVTAGRGQVEFWTALSDQHTPAGEQIENGASVTDGTETFVFFIPEEEGDAKAVIENIIVAYGDTEGENITDVVLLNAADAADYYYQLDPEKQGDVIVTTTFSDELQAIKLIFGDNGDDQPVEVYTIQGVKVEASEDLIPGIYIIRRGDKSSKVLIRR